MQKVVQSTTEWTLSLLDMLNPAFRGRLGVGVINDISGSLMRKRGLDLLAKYPSLTDISHLGL